MRLAGAKAHGAEEAANVGGIVLLEAGFGQGAVVHQPLEAKHADGVGLGFFQSAESRANGFADIGFARGGARERGAQAVADFVKEGAGEVAFAGYFGGLVGAHHTFGHGQNDVVDARIHKILKENFL